MSALDDLSKQIEKGLIDFAKTYDDQLAEATKGTLLGSHPVDDVTHAELYLLEKNGIPPNPITGHPGKEPRPLMPIALKYLEGGEAEIKRFGRTLAKAMSGELQPGPLLAREILKARMAAQGVADGVSS